MFWCTVETTYTHRPLFPQGSQPPSSIKAVNLKTLAHRATRICEMEHLQEELHNLEETSQSNGYLNAEIKQIQHLRRRSVCTNHETKQNLQQQR